MWPLILSLSLPYEDTVRRQPPASQEENFHLTSNWHPDFGFSGSRTERKTFLLSKPPSLLYFLTAAQAD